MSYNYFDFTGLNKPYSLFLISSGYQPKVDSVYPDYFKYSKTQRKEIKKQFAKEFSNWQDGKKISYSPKAYLEAAAKFLPRIKYLPDAMRSEIIENIKAADRDLNDAPSGQILFTLSHLSTPASYVQSLISELQGLPSWKELHQFFHSDHVHLPYPDRIKNALARFNDPIIEKAIIEDLFDLSCRQFLCFYPVQDILECLEQDSLKQAFFQSVLQHHENWLNIIISSFPSSISYYVTDKTEKASSASHVPQELFVSKLLDTLKQYSPEKAEGLKISLQCNIHFAQYVAEQVMRYASVIREREGIAFYPPLYEAVRKLSLNQIILDLQQGKQQLHYISPSVLDGFLEYYSEETQRLE